MRSIPSFTWFTTHFPAFRSIEGVEQERKNETHHEVDLRHHDLADILGILESLVTRFQPQSEWGNAKEFDNLNQYKSGQDAAGQQSNERRLTEQEARHEDEGDQEVEEFSEYYDGNATFEKTTENYQAESDQGDRNAENDQGLTERTVEDPGDGADRQDDQKSDGRAKRQPAVERSRLAESWKY